MKILRFLALVVVIALAVLSVKLASDHAADQASLAALSATLTATEKAAQTSAAQVKILHAQLAQLQAQIPPAAPADTTVAAGTAPAPPKKNPMAQMAEMLKSPAMHDMMVAQQKQAVQLAFGDLIKHFNFTPDERDQFVKLLTDRQMNQMDIGLKLMDGGNLTADDRAGLAQQIKDANAADDTQIQQFLNNDTDYAYYQTYVQQQPERTELSMLNTTLAKDNIPLDSTQTDSLASLMYDARKNFKFTTDFSDPSAAATISPDTLTDQTIQTYEQQQEQLQDQIAEQAANILSPEQLAAFKQNQTQMRQLTQMGLNMSRQMLGGGK
jgi:hypothetical protein